VPGDGALGEALGQKYVEQTFGADGKQRMLKMVDALEKALDQDIKGLPWMSDDTKKQAKVKLEAIRNKIGYPDVWRDYSTLTIQRGDLIGNFLRANEFESRRQIAKIGKPLDRKEWGMTPPTVNAYYSGSRNEIVFPAGILQPPFFDKSMDDAVNFGAIGSVIGATAVGLPLAFVLSRVEFRGRRFLQAVATLPAALPPLVTSPIRNGTTGKLNAALRRSTPSADSTRRIRSRSAATQQSHWHSQRPAAVPICRPQSRSASD